MKKSGTVGTVAYGNTCKRRVKSRGWTFTWNNYTDEDIPYCEKELSKIGQYLFEKECGTNGTEHLQGFVYCKNAVVFGSIKKILPKCHIEKMKGTLKQNITYCTKESKTWFSNMDIPKPLKDPLQDKELYDWQKELLKKLDEEPDDRKILWYVDYIGNCGKTTLAKSIAINHPNKMLYLSGKSNDLKYGVSEFIKNNELKICIFDFSRSLENYISYEGIESIKNGIFFNNKYESKMCIFNPPHIVCFSNFYPDTDKLSQDRWEITELNASVGFD